jgi:hypothetical protein
MCVDVADTADSVLDCERKVEPMASENEVGAGDILGKTIVGKHLESCWSGGVEL